MPSIETNPFRDGLMALLPGGSASLKKGQMVTPENSSTSMIRLDFSCTVTASQAVTAFDEAARDAVLRQFNLHFKSGLSRRKPDYPFTGRTFDRLRRDARRVLWREMIGFTDNTNGLARTFGTGPNDVRFTMYVPVSRVAAVRESGKLFGFSPAQMKDAHLEVRLSTDPFKAQSAYLSMSGLQVLVSPVYENARGARVGVPVCGFELTNPKQRSIETPGGLVISLEQMKSLISTQLGDLTVTRGKMDGATEKTPGELQSAYAREAEPGQVDLANTDTRTLIEGLSRRLISEVTMGVVSARQKTLGEEWDAFALALPYLDEEQIWDALTLEAQELPAGQEVCAVNTATLEGIEVDDEHLAVVGFTVYRQSEADFASYPSLRCRSGGKPYVYCPPHLVRLYAREVREALTPSPLYPTGDAAAAEAICQRAARWLPGATVDETGFGTLTHAYGTLRKLLMDEAKAMADRSEAVAAFLKMPKTTEAVTKKPAGKRS